MPDRPSGGSDLSSLFHSRKTHYSHIHSQMNELLDVYNGKLPPRFMAYFPDELDVHVVNMIRLAWDDLAAMTGKTFPIFVHPRNNTTKAKQEAEKVERIALGYNGAAQRIGGLGMDALMDRLAWWVVGCADAVALALPDYDRKTPFFTYRDPRTHLPPVGWTPWSQAPLDHSLFAYPMTLAELEMRYPDKRDELRRNNSDTMGRYDRNKSVWVGEYYCTDSWIVATLEDRSVTLVRSDAGDRGHPGVCPVVPFTLHNAQHPKGRSMFADQVSMQAAMSRMFSQKLAFYDRTLFPTVFTTPLVGGKLKYGPNAVNVFDTSTGITPAFHQQAPANAIDADQMMQFTMGLSRMLNRNPESFQGAGQADSAKALNALRQGVEGTVQDLLWPAFIEGMPKLYAAAAAIDLNLWGNERKKVSGRQRNTPFVVEYVPNVHLKPYAEDIQIEPGLGLGGTEGKIQIMQLLGAGLISKETALEQIPDFPEPEKEMRRIESNQLKELMFADLAAKAQQGALAPGAFAEIKRLVEEEDMSIFDAISQLEASGRLMPPPPEAAPTGPEMGGMPPELAALMGGGPSPLEQGAIPEAPMSLGALRG